MCCVAVSGSAIPTIRVRPAVVATLVPSLPFPKAGSVLAFIMIILGRSVEKAGRTFRTGTVPDHACTVGGFGLLALERTASAAQQRGEWVVANLCGTHRIIALRQ